ncbi:MAG: exodeoxyribonuclease VII large subunit, partial [Bdellovibrionales bacterium]|nr:exodeoxyribonuclease VII large subunit [Bdellovibrionales bacterium]
SYQIMCTHMEPMGAGALQLAFEQLKKKLDKEGLFDPSHKKALPKIPHHIAVITSPTGAAIRDIINVLNRRFKNAQVTVIPTLVQGASAAQSILASLDQAQRFNQQKPIDVLIVGRGGGSIEDLWCFNDEAVARAIYACPIPVVSAVGHEIDFTISDFVADLRAPTPSAAAELVVRSSEELNRFIVNYSKQMFRRMKNILQQSQQRLIHLEKRVVDPQRKLQDLMLRLDELNMRLNNSVRRNLFQIQNHVVHLSKRIVNPLVLVKNLQNRHHLLSRNLLVVIEGLVEKKKYKYDRLNSLLDSYSPLRVVDRGYSLVLDEKKGLIKSVQQLKVNDKIQIQLKDGMAYAHVDKVTKGDK